MSQQNRRMKEALKEIIDLTQTMGYDLGYPEVYRIAQEALNNE